jgi:hypothetical protein
MMDRRRFLLISLACALVAPLAAAAHHEGSAHHDVDHAID